MPYYADGSGYAGGSGYYGSGTGGGFGNHSSLMTGVNRYFNPIAARYSPHLSTISETPSLLHLRRHTPQTSTSLAALTRPCRRIIDTADIDVSTPPRSLSQDNNRQQRHRLRRDRPTIKIRSQALKDNPALREYNEKHEKTVGELLVEKFLIKEKGAERKMRLYHQASLARPSDKDDLLSKEKENEILAAIARRVTRRMTRRRSSADIVPLDPEQIKREAALQAAQAEVLDTLVAEEQAEIECEVRRGTFAKRPAMRLPQEISEVSESEDDTEVADAERKVHATAKKKKRRKSLDKPPPPAQDVSDEEDEEDDDDDDLITEITESIIEEEEEEDFEWDDRKKCDDIRKVLPVEVDKEEKTRTTKSEVNDAKVVSDSFVTEKLDDKLRTVSSERVVKEEPPVKSEIEQRLDQMNAKIKNLKKEVRETDRRETDKIIQKDRKKDEEKPITKDDATVRERPSKTLKRTKSAPQTIETSPGFKIEACNSVGDFSTLFVKAANVTEEFRESIRLPAPRSSSPPTEVVVLPVRKPYVLDTSRNSVYLALKPSQNIRAIVVDADTRKEDTIKPADESRPAKCDATDHRSIIENDDSAVAVVSRRSALGRGGDEFVSWWDETPEEDQQKSAVISETKVEDRKVKVTDKAQEEVKVTKKVTKSKLESTAKIASDKATKVVEPKIKSKVVVNGVKEVKDKVDEATVGNKAEVKVEPSRLKVLVNDLKETKVAVNEKVDSKAEVKVEPIKQKVILGDLKETKVAEPVENKVEPSKSKVLVNDLKEAKATEKVESKVEPSKPKALVNDLKETKITVNEKVDNKAETKVEPIKQKVGDLKETKVTEKIVNKVETPPKITKKSSDLQDKSKIILESSKETKEKEAKNKVEVPTKTNLEKDNKVKVADPQDKPKAPIEEIKIKVDEATANEKLKNKIEVPAKTNLAKEKENKVSDLKTKPQVLEEIKTKVTDPSADQKIKIKPAVLPKPQIKDKVENPLISEKTETKVKITTKEKVEEKIVDKVVDKSEEKSKAPVEALDKNFKSVIVEIKDKPEEKITEPKLLTKQTEKSATKLEDKKEKVPDKLSENKNKVISKPTDTKEKITSKVNEVKEPVTEKVVPKPADNKEIVEKEEKRTDKAIDKVLDIKEKVTDAKPKEKASQESKPEVKSASPQKKAQLAPSEESREKSASPTNENKRKATEKKLHNDLIIGKPEVPVRPDRRHLPRIPEEQQPPAKPVDNKSDLAPKKDKEDRKRKVDSEAVMKIEKKILEDAESPDKILTSAMPQKKLDAEAANSTVVSKKTATPGATEIDFWNEIGDAEKVQSRVDTEEDRKSLKLDLAKTTPEADEESSETTPLISQPATPLVENLSQVPLANLQERSVSVDEELLLQDDERSGTVKKIKKWTNHDNLANINDTDADVTPLASQDASPSVSASSSTVVKKKVVKKKKSTTGKKKASEKGESTKGTKKTTKKKISADSPQTSQLKTPMSAFGSPRNTPAQRPPELNKLFYTTPAILLTATPRDLRKVRRAKVKRKKPPTRTPSLSSDSTGSTRSTATTTSTEEGSNCEEDADHKRLASTRSNDSGFDGSPRLSNSGESWMRRTRSELNNLDDCDMVCHKKCEKLTGNLCGLNQKLVAEALQALKQKDRDKDKDKGPVYTRHGRKSFVRRRLRPYLNPYGYVDPQADLADITFDTPSQSSENQRNADSDHYPHSGRITPPATNLPRFKKYEVTDFNFLKVLGKGSFGKVLLAELRGTDCVYAVKCLKKDVVLEDDDVECTLIERKVLTLATRHPYLCHLFCTFQTESHLFFVMEYLNGGDLMFHIQKSGRFSEARAKFYAAEIWSGLIFLHKKGIVYRDLKLDNVLLDFEGHIRIADFGMCKLQIFLDRTADTFCGTPDYMAPEIIKGLKYNQAVDWWSFGVLLYEMLTGQSPFSGCDEDELFWSICNERPFIPRYLSQSSTDMLVSLLEKDAGKRIPGHEIACHPFFCTIAWDKLERRSLEPPFKPAVEHTLDTRYFDTAFTTERPRLTPVPEQILTSMDQAVFRGFSYTNPNATD